MITSVHNPKIQAVRKLQAQVKARREGKAFAIEGVRLSEEALHAGWDAQQVFFTDHLDERGRAVVSQFTSRGVPSEQVTDAVMKAICETETPQGLLVVAAQRTPKLPPAPDFVLILDGLRDPGNMGTILRTAAAAAVQVVLITPDSVDAWSPKVLRAGMGAHFRLTIQSMGWQEITHTLKGPFARLRIYLAEPAGGIPYTLADFQLPLALVIGGEAVGAGRESRLLADEKVHIPMLGSSESLNAGVAASILLFEVVRQRGR